jgi:exopolyphosphatase/guanosine-5'-triphosphate,3'-diphosphate pyrophosphatase
VIAIDLGSNSLRVIEYDGTVWGNSFEQIVRTAEGLNQTNEIGQPALERIINSLNDAQQSIDFSSHDIVAITTAAMRMASNSEAIIEQIKLRTGIHFRIIDGDEEAALTLMAVQNCLHLLNIPSDEYVLVDIGGGSTEVIVVAENKIESKSFPLGIVTLSEKSQTIDDAHQELDAFREKITFYIQSLKLSSSPNMLVLTAGTPTTIAAYLQGMDYHSYDASRVNGTVLERIQCMSVLRELLNMDEKTRSRYVGVGREQLIVIGIYIVEMIFDALDLQTGIVVDDGLREGVALNHFHTH